MSATILTYDPAKRRRPTASAIDAAYSRRLGYQGQLAEIEAERVGIRERLPHAQEGSEYRSSLLCRLATMNEDIELLHALLDEDNVVRIGGRRHG